MEEQCKPKKALSLKKSNNMKAYLTILLIFYLSGAAGSAEIAAKTFMEISLKPLQSGGKALVCCGTVSAGKVTRLSIWSPPADCSALKICEAWSGLTAITLHMNSKVKFAGFVDAIKGFQELRELVITDSRDANPINWAKVGEIVTLKSLVLVPGEHAKTWLADLAAQQTLGMLNTLTINYSTTSD